MDNKTKFCPFVKENCEPDKCPLDFGIKTEYGWTCAIRYLAEKLIAANEKQNNG